MINNNQHRVNRILYQVFIRPRRVINRILTTIPLSQCPQHIKDLVPIALVNRYERSTYPNRILSVKYRKNIKTDGRQFIGCSHDEYIEYLKPLLKEDMSFDNYAYYWNIHHVIPTGSIMDNLFDYEYFMKVLHYTNTVPLTIRDHWAIHHPRYTVTS